MIMALTIRGQRTDTPNAQKTRSRRTVQALSVGAVAVRPRQAWYLPCKHALDFVAAVVLAVLAAPVVLLAAVLVKLTTRGPAFYTQTRVGAGGKHFTIYKVRTMIHNAESLTGARWSLPGDPRVTLVGRFLRASHLDELPQLWNVLRGEMSLIGPRPERPEFVPDLEKTLPGYGNRLLLRPGVTGLAQVNLPPDTDVESVRRKLTCDLYYVRHVSPWLDLRLLACTALYAVGVPFRLSRRLLGVPGLDEAAREAPELLEDRQRLVA
jgi:lipopolysaccharide/colanic/teichoic acid biosynthesis glycosyltransferase